jgi:hypothetical protein
LENLQSRPGLENDLALLQSQGAGENICKVYASSSGVEVSALIYNSNAGWWAPI